MDATSKGGMFPVRVQVESVRPNHCLTCAHSGQIITDTYTIINAHTQLGNLVETVLSALGMPHLVQDSRGLIQIQNWKPIPFESITDNQEELAANLFKEISQSVILKILTKHGAMESHSAQCITQLKDRILKMAMEKQPQFLLQMIDNHEVKKIVQQVVNGDELSLSESQIQAINEWMDNLVENQPTDRKSPRSSTVRFSPVSEIPLLERWFRSDANPSRQQLQKYMSQLNNAPYRRSNPKITYQQICNWFTNQRAAARESGGGNTSSASRGAAQSLENSAALLMQQALNNAASASNSSGGFQWPNSFAAFLGSQPLNLTAALNGGDQSGTSPNRMTGSPPPAGGSHIPLTNQPMDIRSKFDASNAYNPLADRHHHHQTDATAAEVSALDGGGFTWRNRIDGGSESPMGNDNESVHSASENCGYDGDLKESLISSPDMSIDLVANAFSPQNHAAHKNGGAGGGDLNAAQEQAATAAAMAALQQFVPIGLLNSSLGSVPFSSASGGLDANALAQFAAAAAQSFAPASSSASASATPARHARDDALMMAADERPSSAAGGGGSRRRDHNNTSAAAARSSGAGDAPKDHAAGQQQPATPQSQQNGGASAAATSARSRLMFDPLSELPILERWFDDNPHPGWLQIEEYTNSLNSLPYRQNYPPISTHNVKIWFKNRRAKNKRILTGEQPASNSSGKIALSAN